MAATRSRPGPVTGVPRFVHDGAPLDGRTWLGAGRGDTTAPAAPVPRRQSTGHRHADRRVGAGERGPATMRRWGYPTACSWVPGPRIRTRRSRWPWPDRCSATSIRSSWRCSTSTNDRLRQVFAHVERPDAAGQRDRIGRHGGVVRELRPAGRPGRRRGQRRLRRAHVRGGGPAAAPTSSGSTPRGASRSTRTGLLAAHPAPAIIAVVHAETSTGVRNDIAPLGRGKGDALLLVDMVTSLGGIEVAVDDWAVDIAYSGTQKCLGVPPGLAPLTVSRRGPWTGSSSGRRAGTSTSTSWRATSTTARAGTGVPPHGAGGHGGRAARRPGGVARRGARGRPQQRHAECGGCCRTGSSSLGLELLVEADAPAAAAHDRPGARRGSTRPRAGASSWLLRDRDRGRGRDSWPGRSGGSAAWGTRRGGGTCSRCSVPWRRYSDDERGQGGPPRTAGAAGQAGAAALADRGRLPRLARGADPVRRLAAALGAPAQGRARCRRRTGRASPPAAASASASATSAPATGSASSSASASPAR